ncbi:DUF2326 domain-containing protein [Marinilactibacillus psychrotolerans]|uniref:DUF2326 domain-containing protein n=1 Tax=Marinilactibacillus psychrotolerans TaxID=191770 RepID=UPI003889246A
MIYQLTSDFPEFSPIDFHSGINIILAKRSQNTTNGLGKTLLIACIDFVLGSNYKKSLLTKYPELNNYTITLQMDYKNEKISASRMINQKESSKIFVRNLQNDKEEYIPVSKWKDDLLMDKFSYDGNLSMLTWRSLLNFFIKDSSVNNFDNGLKGFQSDNLQKTTVYQSFLINIAFEEIERSFLSESLKTEGKNLTSYINKLKLVVDSTPELVPNDVENYAIFQRKINSEINKESNSLLSYQNRIDLLQLELGKLHESLNYIENVVPNNRAEELYSVLDAELQPYIKKSFSEANEFHKKLISENKIVINEEIRKIQNDLSDTQFRYRQLQNKIKHLLSVKKEKSSTLSTVNATSLVLNELLNKPSNEISKEVSSRVEKISAKNKEKINRNIDTNQDTIESYRMFLSKHVNEVYDSNKKIDFDIFFDTALRIVFSYKDDSGTGKSNMKLLIYYYFILIINNKLFERNMDMLIVDTDFTDGIDSNNLIRFFYSVENELIENNCQLIFTLRDDRSVSIQESAKKEWIRRILTDEDDGYLFKKGLIKE